MAPVQRASTFTAAAPCVVTRRSGVVQCRARAGDARSQPSAAKQGREVDCPASRRALLLGLSVVPFTVSLPASAGLLDGFGGGGGLNYSAVRNDVIRLVQDDPDKGPTLVRLAWHSSGTYDKMTKTGGSSKGTIRFKEELSHAANAGLYTAVGWLEPVYKKYAGKGLSYADLYTLGGVAAISAMGGPDIPWRSGRVDAMDPSDVPPEGRLPAADKGSPESTAQGLRDVFYRMGFNDREIVALTGAHTLGRGHPEFSGYDGPWTAQPTTFSNLYYTFLLNLTWEGETLESGIFQYTDAATRKFMMLPADLVMIEDPKFKEYVELYAKDKNQFFKDFSVAFQKLEELGCTGLQEVSFA